MFNDIRVRKLPGGPLYRASGKKSNSLCAYGTTKERAIWNLKQRRRANRFTPSDLLYFIF